MKKSSDQTPIITDPVDVEMKLWMRLSVAAYVALNKTVADGVSTGTPASLIAAPGR